MGNSTHQTSAIQQASSTTQPFSALPHPQADIPPNLSYQVALVIDHRTGQYAVSALSHPMPIEWSEAMVSIPV